MLKTLYFKWVFIKFFEIFEKTDFFTFFKKWSKSCFWSILTSNSERASKIRWGGCFWTYQNLFFGKYLKNKNFQFFPKKSYNKGFQMVYKLSCFDEKIFWSIFYIRDPFQKKIKKKFFEMHNNLYTV